MKEALKRTIQTLIDSGGDPWEFNSKDIEMLVEWIQGKQNEEAKGDDKESIVLLAKGNYLDKEGNIKKAEVFFDEHEMAHYFAFKKDLLPKS